MSQQFNRVRWIWNIYQKK